jgi:hypothetical protein
MSMRRLIIAASLIVVGSSLSAQAADVTIHLVGASGQTASVFLNGDDHTWSGTNGGNGDLLKARSGSFTSGTNVIPGFAVKGTGLLVGKDGKEVEAFFYNLIPDDLPSGDKRGDAHMVGTGEVGKWEVR